MFKPTARKKNSDCKRYTSLILLGALLGILTGCRSTLPQPAKSITTPVRFILTFDDGPSALEERNPTRSILEQLKYNPVQANIKAVFFVQTRAHNAGGTAIGQQLLQQEYAAGHVLGFHTASPLGHVGHLQLSETALQETLQAGISDLGKITGKHPIWLRPPYFSYSDTTAEAYHEAGFKLILSDLSANDGVIHFNSFRRTTHFANRLLELHHRLALMPDLPNPLPNPLPIVVTFHDVNRYTADNLLDYLQILVKEAKWAGLVTADKPFYDNSEELQTALNTWWAYNDALRRSCWSLTCPTIGNYLPNRNNGKLAQSLEKPPS